MHLTCSMGVLDGTEVEDASSEADEEGVVDGVYTWIREPAVEKVAEVGVEI